jgi:PIN domain nuclease of toxin-antitoxin system
LRLLLDTQAALWWLSDEGRLGDAAERQLRDVTNEVLLSAAVVWEVAVKRSLGKLKAPPDFAATLLAGGAHALAVTVEHVAAVERLPWHHRDPFDRILVAQTEIEQATLVSRDEVLGAYSVPVIW